MVEGRDLRKSGRRRTLFGGVMYDEGDNAWNCFIADVSEKGAKVKSSAELQIGSFVDLKINRFNDMRRCKVMWVREGHIGLEFLVKMDKNKEGVAEFFKLMERQ